MKTYRIANRFRFVTFVVLTIVILTCVVNLALGLGTAHSSTIQDFAEINITSGDTLWDIAERYMPSDLDTRKAVYSLCKINNITASDLKAGMTILVPIYNA